MVKAPRASEIEAVAEVVGRHRLDGAAMDMATLVLRGGAR